MSNCSSSQILQSYPSAVSTLQQCWGKGAIPLQFQVLPESGPQRLESTEKGEERGARRAAAGICAFAARAQKGERAGLVCTCVYMCVSVCASVSVLCVSVCMCSSVCMCVCVCGFLGASVCVCVSVALCMGCGVRWAGDGCGG